MDTNSIAQWATYIPPLAGLSSLSFLTFNYLKNRSRSRRALGKDDSRDVDIFSESSLDGSSSSASDVSEGESLYVGQSSRKVTVRALIRIFVSGALVGLFVYSLVKTWREVGTSTIDKGYVCRLNVLVSVLTASESVDLGSEPFLGVRTSYILFSS